MSDKPWKAWERDIASRLGGQRRGADFRSADGGKTDVVLEGFAIECKLLGAPTYSAMLAACKQAESNAEEGQIPIAFVRRKNQPARNSLVVMRLEVWEQWYGK